MTQFSFPTRVRGAWSTIQKWRDRLRADLRPGPEARKGAAWGAVAAAAAAATITALNLDSGFGLWVDFLFCFAAAGIGILLAVLLVALLLSIFRTLPRLVSGFIVGSCLVVAVAFFPPPLGLPVAVFVGILEGILGAMTATLLFGHFRQAALSKKIITIVLFLFAVGDNVGMCYFFLSDGTAEQMVRLQQSTSPVPPPLAAANPAEAGPYAVKLLFYGSGHDLRRPEYGRSVAIKTPVVDASRLIKDFNGWRRDLRLRYWGFDIDKLPLNARVWYPDGPGPFPLVLMVHGNHKMTVFSDPGYQYLGELLASRGFILASIDENFLNGGLFADLPNEQAVRGWMLLEHLRQWHAWNNTPGSPFYKKVDLDNVALLGQSRGGEAAATAVLFNTLSYYPDDALIRFNYHYPIKSVVAIAPADGQYKPAGEGRTLEDVNYLTLQGANDADVSTFAGSGQWERVHFTGNGKCFKAALYIYRANHGQFNTVWGRTDGPAPWNWLLDLKPLISGDDQRRVAKTYIAGFLEATLHDRREYLPMFADYRRIRNWLPGTLYVNRYEDATCRPVADFNEDVDVTTATLAGGRIEGENLSVWREGRIPFRMGDRAYNGVFLGWNRGEKGDGPAGSYTISFPVGALKATASSSLGFSIAAVDEDAPLPGGKEAKRDKKKDREPPDFTVELAAGDGTVARRPLSDFGVVPPPFRVRFTKLKLMDSIAYEKPSEPEFQTVTVPLSAFPKVDPARLRSIRLRFDRTRASMIIISEIGISTPR